MTIRGDEFRERQENRYWWHRLPQTHYIPPVYQCLTDEEWSLIVRWFDKTQKEFGQGGECSVPAMNVIQGFLSSGGVKTLVQLGHYVGYSTLLLGFVLRRMGLHQCLFSVDLSEHATAFTQHFLDEAGLNDQVKLVVSDSSRPQLVDEALSWFGRGISAVFVDSSHQYRHTLEELNLWYPAIEPGGLMFLHDVSEQGISYDASRSGGVQRAVKEWKVQNPDASVFILNKNANPVHRKNIESLIYPDGCGLGIVQKPCP